MTREAMTKNEDKKPKKRRAKGEGSIVKIGKDHWKNTITVTDGDKKQARKVFYGKTREEAKEQGDRYKLSLKDGLLPEDEDTTVQEWVKAWLFSFKVHKLKASSLAKYEGIYRNYIKDSKLGKIKLKNIKPSHLQNHYNGLLKNGATPGAIKSLNKLLKASMSQALIERLLMLNPCLHVNLPEVESTSEVLTFTVEELNAFLTAASKHRHKALFILAMGTGLRQAELLGLRWQDIDMVNSEINIVQTIRREAKIDLETGEKPLKNKTEFRIGTPKSRKGERMVPLPKFLIHELKIHQLMQNGEKARIGDGYVDNDLVFPNEIGEPTDARNLTRSYKRLLARAGVEYKNFHVLRHTYATLLLEKEVPIKTISELLGHSDTRITSNTYTHVVSKTKKEAVKKIDDLFAL